MIAQPDEITETEIRVSQIPEILDEGFRDAVVSRLQQLIARQTTEAESPQRLNEFRGHSVVTQLLELVERKISVSCVGQTPDERGSYTVIPQSDEPASAADAISSGTERLHVLEAGTVHPHDDKLIDGR